MKLPANKVTAAGLLIALGIIYGDIGTSPLYVFNAIIGDRLINEELSNLRGLVKEGYAPRNRQLEMERMVADVNAGLADLQGNTERARRAIGELRQRALSRQQEYRKEVETQLADVSREVLSDNEKLHAVRDDLGRTEIKAPAAGQVVGLAVQSLSINLLFVDRQRYLLIGNDLLTCDGEERMYD